MLCAAPPMMKCPQSVVSGVYKESVRLVCHIQSTTSLSAAHVSWNGKQRLRPTAKPGWPPGVLFDRNDEYLAYLRQVQTSVAVLATQAIHRWCFLLACFLRVA